MNNTTEYFKAKFDQVVGTLTDEISSMDFIMNAAHEYAMDQVGDKFDPMNEDQEDTPLYDLYWNNIGTYYMKVLIQAAQNQCYFVGSESRSQN